MGDGTVKTGTFPVHANDFFVNKGTKDVPEWVSPAELEEISVSIDNTTQTWNTFKNKGWQSALVTGKAATITIKGKRYIGDEGNDLIASKLLKSGQEAYIGVKIAGADGKSLIWHEAACAVGNDGKGGQAVDV